MEASVGQPLASHSYVRLLQLPLPDSIRSFPNSNIRHCVSKLERVVAGIGVHESDSYEM